MTFTQSAQQKDRFLESYAECSNISLACELSGVARRSVYLWKEHDEEFALAMVKAEAEFTERLEEEARRRAVEGTMQTRGVYFKGKKVDEYTIREYSDTLLLALLKANKPEKYKERVSVESTSIIKTYVGISYDDV